MGCGASSGSTKDSVIVTKDTVESPRLGVGEATTWATKSDAKGGAANSVGGRDHLDSKGGHGVIRDGGLMLSDADDDDEIEIIQEGKYTSTHHARPAAANAQEAPEACEPEQNKADKEAEAAKAKALSKRQQEEAAKLAEQRKRFDNQRSKGWDGPTTALPTTTVTASSRSPVSSAPPKHEMMMSLNLSKAQVDNQDRNNNGAMDLPGGIFDDTPRDKINPVKRPKNQHEEFDDEDERLMKEILESEDVM